MKGRRVGFQLALLDHLERTWREPDNGIWEVRGERRHFVHSKFMAWVGFDRAVRGAERHGLPGPAARWREIRDQIHAEVCEKGFDADRNTFTQSYGSRALDAAVLLMPRVGFCRTSIAGDRHGRGDSAGVDAGRFPAAVSRRFLLRR
jgi:GH15 family glucan-1,4-alpha-glucosidase